MAINTPTDFGTDLDEHAEWIKEFGRRNAKMLGVVAVVLAAAIAIWIVYSKTEATKNARADAALSSARQTYALGNLPLAKTDLTTLTTRYSGTDAAAQARVLLAQIAFDQGKPADGLKALEGASESGPAGAAVIAMRAAGYSQDQKYEEAAKSYLEAADRASAEAEKHRYQAQAALAYATAGKKDEAVKIWRDLLASEDTFYSQEAQLRLGELTATPATKS